MSQQKWDSHDVPDQKGRVAIVTGSSGGIGYETARVLAAKNLWEVSEEMTRVKYSF